MAGSAIAQPVSQKWDGSVPNWEIRVTLIGDQIRGEFTCYRIKYGNWAPLWATFAATLDAFRNFSTTATRPGTWAARRVSGTFPRIKIEPLADDSGYDCPGALEILLKRIAEGEISRAEVEAALTAAALAAGLKEGEISSTIASGLSSGQAQPRRRVGDPPSAAGDPLLNELAQLNETDTDNARRLVKRFGASLGFVPERKRWFVFDGEVWRADAAKQQIAFAQDSAQLIAGEVDLIGEDRRADRRRWANSPLLKSRSDQAVSTVTAMIRIANPSGDATMRMIATASSV
jgi:hypothetical protein